MPFEVLLTQIPNLPSRFFLQEYHQEGEVDGETNERIAIEKLDNTLKDIKLPTMLLERLKKEFDENFKISKRTSSTNSSGGESEGQPHPTTPKVANQIKSFFGVGGSSLGKVPSKGSTQND